VDLVDDHGAHRRQHLPAAADVSSRYSDSGVVTRMCGGVFTIAARAAGVSPVRTAAVMRGAVSPCAAATAASRARLLEVLVDVGAQRLSGDTYSTRTSSGSGPSRLSRTSSSMAEEEAAASVLPDPVGAAISVWLASRDGRQPRSCASRRRIAHSLEANPHP
jgi:hypothetical protein